MDGLDTIEAMRGMPEGKDMPVIFLADKHNLQMRDLYQKIGLAGILYKPLQAAYLPDMIAQIWSSISHESALEGLTASENAESFSPA
jgi:CheY-like chemotaxis protein